MKLELLEKLITSLKDSSELTDKNDRTIIDKIEKFILQSGSKQLYKINANELSQTFNVSAKELLRIMLYFSAQGIFNISYDIQCPDCKLITSEYNSLSEIIQETHCPQCGIDVDVDFGKSAFITFVINDKILSMDMGEMFAEKNSELVASRRTGNLIDYPTVLQALSLWEYHKLYPSEIISSTGVFPIENLTALSVRINAFESIILKNDDMTILEILREFQNSVSDAVKRNSGKMVKVFGSHIIAIFHSPKDAVKAAFTLNNSVPKTNEKKPLLLCTGIHSGPALCYSIDGNMDFFGKTIHYADQLSHICEGRHITISETIRNDEESISEIMNITHKLKHAKIELEGCSGLQDIYLAEIH